MFSLVRARTLVPAVLLLLAVAAASALAQSGGGSMAGMNMDQPSRYMAMLAPSNGASGPRGMLMVNGTALRLTLSGAKPGAVLPWHLHKGTCGDDKGVLEVTGGHTPITVDADGKATAQATLRAPLDAAGSFVVAVHASASDLKAVIACAPLKPGKM